MLQRTKEVSARRALFDRLKVVRNAERISVPVRYASAIAAVVVTMAASSWLFGHQAPWFLFVPAIVLIALGLGSGPAVVATPLSAFAAAFGASLQGRLFQLSPVQWLASVIFVVVTLGLIAVVQALRSTLLEMETVLVEQTENRAVLAERGEFLASVLASSTDCIKVLDLEGRLTFMSEGGQRVMEVSDFNTIRGCPWPDFWQGQGNKDAVAALTAAQLGNAASFLGQASTMGGTSKWWHVAVSPIAGPDGAPERILSVSRDITALKESEAERDRYVRVIDTSTDFIGMAHLDGSVFFLNEAGRRLVGLEPHEVPSVHFDNFFAPEQVADMAAKILPAVERDGRWSGERLFRNFKTGELIPVIYTVFPVLDASGTLLGYGTVTRDYRQEKRALEQQAIVNGEISHRLKNVLAMVQALAAQTLRGVAEPEALKAFDQRLAALSKAQDALMRGTWDAADLGSLVRETLDVASVLERCEITGPPVQLGPRATLSTSLLLHELATNASKYGSLSQPEGRVKIRWDTEGEDEKVELVLSWCEQGGPPAAAPTRKGFGSRLLRLGLVGTGGSDLSYSEQGFLAAFRAPLSQIGDA